MPWREGWPGGQGHCVLCWLCYCLASYMTLEIFLNITFQFIKQFCTHYLPHLLLTETLPVGQTLSLTSLWQTLHCCSSHAKYSPGCRRQGPTGSCLRPPVRPHPLPLSLCSFCYCHPGLLTAPQTQQEDSGLTAFAFTIFSACMLSPGIHTVCFLTS